MSRIGNNVSKTIVVVGKNLHTYSNKSDIKISLGNRFWALNKYFYKPYSAVSLRFRPAIDEIEK